MKTPILCWEMYHKQLGTSNLVVIVGRCTAWGNFLSIMFCREMYRFGELPFFYVLSGDVPFVGGTSFVLCFVWRCTVSGNFQFIVSDDMQRAHLFTRLLERGVNVEWSYVRTYTSVEFVVNCCRIAVEGT